MTALSLSAIPSNINSYERLFVWCAQALQSANDAATVKVVDGQAPLPVVGVSTGKVADGTSRFVVMAYIPLDQDGLNDPNQKTWMAADDIGTAAPNVVYGAN